MRDVRKKWTDERLDDLNKKVDDGFQRMDVRFESLHRLTMHGFMALVGFQLTGLAAILGFIAAKG